MSKFTNGDTVRVTMPGSQYFDAMGQIATVFEEDTHSPESYRVQLAGWGLRIYGPHDLTLADPDVHTVLNQMDAESAPAAFKVGERVMIRGHVGSYGGRFGMIHGRETDSTTQWLVRLDGNPVTMPFTEDELTRPHMPAAPFDNDLEPDPVNHPAHYGGDTTYEVIKVAEAWGLDKDAYLFNVLKYVARAGKKGDVLEDLDKGAFYLDRRRASMRAAQ